MTRKEENTKICKSIDDLVNIRGISPEIQHAITNTYLCDISKSLAIIADEKTDREEPDDKATLKFYTTICTNCGSIVPISDYCMWCGKKGTCIEGGEAE